MKRGRGTERIVLWCLALLVASLCAWAAVWQYGRGHWKAEYLANWERALERPARPLAGDDFQRQVAFPEAVTGELLRRAKRWLLLDNQRLGAEVGMHAYALYSLAGSAGGSAILIDFGWLPMLPRRQLPALDPPPPTLHATGMLLAWPGQGIALADNPWTQSDQAVLLTHIDRQEIADQTGLSLAQGVLRLDAGNADPRFTRVAIALPNTISPDQHFGYALQWGGLATTVLIVALVLHVRSRRSE